MFYGITDSNVELQATLESTTARGLEVAAATSFDSNNGAIRGVEFEGPQAASQVIA